MTLLQPSSHVDWWKNMTARRGGGLFAIYPVLRKNVADFQIILYKYSLAALLPDSSYHFDWSVVRYMALMILLNDRGALLTLICILVVRLI